MIYKVYLEISGHLGMYLTSNSFVQFVWLPRIFGIEMYAKDHYLHHAHNNCNYAKRFTIWDKLFGTYKTVESIEDEQQKTNDHSDSTPESILDYLDINKQKNKFVRMGIRLGTGIVFAGLSYIAFDFY
jgi:sterol desaturase/sphingolipid hydroxylase (fatty acid hydroxylase superfamily)